MTADKKNNITKQICSTSSEITKLISMGSFVEEYANLFCAQVFVAMVFDDWCPAQQRAYLNKFRHE